MTFAELADIARPLSERDLNEPEPRDFDQEYADRETRIEWDEDERRALEPSKLEVVEALRDAEESLRRAVGTFDSTATVFHLFGEFLAVEAMQIASDATQSAADRARALLARFT